MEECPIRIVGLVRQARPEETLRTQNITRHWRSIEPKLLWLQNIAVVSAFAEFLSHIQAPLAGNKKFQNIYVYGRRAIQARCLCSCWTQEPGAQEKFMQMRVNLAIWVWGSEQTSWSAKIRSLKQNWNLYEEVAGTVFSEPWGY